MARVGYCIVLTLILGSCAQVGTISGGEKDTAAPAPIPEKTVPENASVFMVGQEVSIVFDEFFTLVDPSQNIQIVPPHAKINARAKGKTLYVSWDEVLKDNTTYAIYLNRAVKDLSEGNDSIIQYVFSTGATLDSLYYDFPIVDATNGRPVQDVTCVLYSESGDLVNYSLSNESGIARMRYLATGRYKPLVFEDENKDMVPQVQERVGFPADSIIAIDSSGIFDPIRLFSPAPKAEIEDVKYQPPASYFVHSTVPLIEPRVFVGEVEVDTSLFAQISENSLQVFVDPDSIFSGSIAVHSELMTDTSDYRLLKSQAQTNTRLYCTAPKNTFAPSETVSIFANDIIRAIDTMKIAVYGEDSIRIYPTFSVKRNELLLDFPFEKTSDFEIVFDANAVSTRVGENTETSIKVKRNSAKKYGSLVVTLEAYTEPIVLVVKQGKTTVHSIPITTFGEPVSIEELAPGEYTFEVIRDRTENGRWDTGDLSSRTQPETIDFFSKPTKVRANWSVEITLHPTHP